MTDTRAQTERLWNELHRDLKQFIRRRVEDDAAADDILQQTFVNVLKGVPKLRDSDSVTGWVYQIARNVIHDHYRSAGRRREQLASAMPERETPDQSPDKSLNAEVGGWLIGMVKSLPEPYREAVHLVEIEGLTQRQTAERTGLSLSGAKSRVQRGRAMLKQTLANCCRLGFDRRGNILSCDKQATGSNRACGCDDT